MFKFGTRKRLCYYSISRHMPTCKLFDRPKRDAMEVLRVPGTKWCGKGFSATRYSQLGGYTRTDRCCRVHDLRCPFWIAGMEKKYGIYNWRVNTLMHCRCDERLVVVLGGTRWLYRKKCLFLYTCIDTHYHYIIITYE